LRGVACKRKWHIQDSQDQILALAFRYKSLKPFKMFPFRSEVAFEWFRGGLVFKAHRLLYHPTLGSRVIKKRRRYRTGMPAIVAPGNEAGYGYPVGPYGTAYRSALRTTRIRRTTRGGYRAGMPASPNWIVIEYNFEAKRTSFKATDVRLYCELQYIHLRVDTRNHRFALKLPPGWSGTGRGCPRLQTGSRSSTSSRDPESGHVTFERKWTRDV